jgi:hypothetical protein
MCKPLLTKRPRKKFPDGQTVFLHCEEETGMGGHQSFTAVMYLATGAMTLFCTHVDSGTIRLIGRWRSDGMLRYLHMQATPLMHSFARHMLSGGE